MRSMPIQVSGELIIAERRGQRPVIVRSMPWAMFADEACERQCQRNHGQSLETIRDRAGFGPAEAVRVICGLSWDRSNLCIPEDAAHKMLYAMRVLFERGQRIAEQAAMASQERQKP